MSVHPRLENRNDMSYWLPRLAEAVPDRIPKTKLISCDPVALWRDAKSRDGEYRRVADAIRTAAGELGGKYPVFLRTGQTSAKHYWKTTCFLERPEDVEDHMWGLIEFSECVDLIGLPCNTWAVREYLQPPPGTPVSKKFMDMPVRREFRCFWRAGKMLCAHPYWPPDALEPELAAEVERTTNMPTTVPEADLMRTLVARAGAAFMEPEGWSIDVLETDRGWMITDMALMPVSWHWPGCPNAPKES